MIRYSIYFGLIDISINNLGEKKFFLKKKYINIQWKEGKEEKKRYEK
jgi:hypothetical protein